jgi:hypothetical protein
MGAPVFTKAELRRAMEVAQDIGATVEIHPRKGLIRLIPGNGAPLEPLDDSPTVDPLSAPRWGQTG